MLKQIQSKKMSRRWWFISTVWVLGVLAPRCAQAQVTLTPEITQTPEVTNTPEVSSTPTPQSPPPTVPALFYLTDTRYGVLACYQLVDGTATYLLDYSLTGSAMDVCGWGGTGLAVLDNASHAVKLFSSPTDTAPAIVHFSTEAYPQNLGQVGPTGWALSEYQTTYLYLSGSLTPDVTHANQLLGGYGPDVSSDINSNLLEVNTQFDRYLLSQWMASDYVNLATREISVTEGYPMGGRITGLAGGGFAAFGLGGPRILTGTSILEPALSEIFPASSLEQFYANDL